MRRQLFGKLCWNLSSRNFPLNYRLFKQTNTKKPQQHFIICLYTYERKKNPMRKQTPKTPAQNFTPQQEVNKLIKLDFPMRFIKFVNPWFWLQCGKAMRWDNPYKNPTLWDNVTKTAEVTRQDTKRRMSGQNWATESVVKRSATES